MSRPSRPCRIATLCLEAKPVKSRSENARRLVLLNEVVRIIQTLSHWHPIDAILLPGAYLRLSQPLGRLSFHRRRELIAKEDIVAPILADLRSLDVLSPHIRLILGVAATPRSRCHTEREDQGCIGFDKNGIIGLARKLFPTRTEFRRRNRISPFEGDYYSHERFVDLPNGSMALLHSGYDLLGTADMGTGSALRREAIKLILRRRGCIANGSPGFCELKAKCLSAWASIVHDHAPDVAIAAVASVAGFGSGLIGAGNWQRYGVATASAALNGALVIAAAHIPEQLCAGPLYSLASYQVPRDQLLQRQNRAACQLPPIASVSFDSSIGVRAMVRLFEPRVPEIRHSQSEGIDWTSEELHGTPLLR